MGQCRTLSFCTSTLVYVHILGAFLAKFPLFPHFSASNWHFYHNQRLELHLSCLVPAFSSLAAPFSKLFTKLSWLLRALVLETKKNTKKNAKMRFFSPSAVFFAEKHFVGCRYIYSRTSLTCTDDSPSKEVYFQNFRQPYSI